MNVTNKSEKHIFNTKNRKRKVGKHANITYGKYCYYTISSCSKCDLGDSELSNKVNTLLSYKDNTVTRSMLNYIMTLHRAPISIMSNRDPSFTLMFWKRLVEALGT